MAPNQGARQTSDAGVLLSAEDLSRVISRIAHEIVEKTSGFDSVVLMGIHKRGYPLAKRIADRINQIDNQKVSVGALDITLHRDDLRMRPPRPLEQTDLPVAGIDGSLVVLVDDVLYSGRTIRAGLDALSELGRPAAVQLAVLIDRGHRELPIRADYVGKNVPTSTGQSVKVRLIETDGVDEVVLSVAGKA
ncbi:MAG: pyrimidine operon regulatory protein [actinobacterium acAMD-5]|jgi:pyrimidine operon attenuation protein/uracil phosphoribosyltransferase|nr:MAG: pyrimidine operon regulatory protein [actinobacterium acAMD-5]